MKRNLKFTFLLMFFVIVLYIPGNAQNITTGLVAHYEFENTTGDAIDAAGSHNGTVVGATRGVPGKVGNAFSFDGNDYVSINNHSDVVGYNQFTLSAWVKPASSSGYRCIITKVHPERDFVLRFSGSDLSVHCYNTSYNSCGKSSALILNQWMHIASTFNNGVWKLYVDGVEVSSCTSSILPPWTSTYMTIGALKTSTEFFIGLIDEVRVYNRALSSADITALYNYTGGASIPALSIDANASVGEGDGRAMFSINASQAGTSDFSFNYTTTNGTATSGSDYVAKSGTHTVAAGSTTMLIALDIIDDQAVESDETFTYTISNPTNATISNATCTITIQDDDVPSSVLSCSNSVTSFPYSESFESASNTWTNATGDDIDWTRKSGATGSSSTGPSVAQEGSYYYYTEASGNNNKVAILESPCFDLTGQSSAEFSFYYHMYGSTMGSLSLEATTDGTNWTSLWSLNGDQGNNWIQATVNLSAYLGDEVKLRFNGTTGSSYRSDMAIDNVTLTTGSTGGVTSVNTYTGNVQLNLSLSNNDLSINGGNTITLPYGTGDITGVTAGTGLSGGGTSGSITVSAKNSEALWNANKIQGITISTTTPTTGQVLKYNGTQWFPSEDETSTGSGTSLWIADDNGIHFNETGKKVGIGTSSPDEALTVAGNIHAEEVVVSTSVPGPDYVFDENYQLRNIRELEEYLQTHRHLPDIPSAKEMEEEGINLSTLNLMLLKRIEELTLYLIDQEKRIQKMETGYK